VEEQAVAAQQAAEPPTEGDLERDDAVDAFEGDKVYIVEFWATWCGPCRVEMPSMERLEQQLGPKGLKIVAVSVDVSGMESRINEFVEEMKLSFEILHDAPGSIQRTYQTTGVPETFIIGRDGKVRRRVIGADDWSSPANVAFLERLLAEPAPE
jgi:thiol-disulfide isomerase/thioredoxin